MNLFCFYETMEAETAVQADYVLYPGHLALKNMEKLATMSFVDFNAWYPEDDTEKTFPLADEIIKEKTLRTLYFPESLMDYTKMFFWKMKNDIRNYFENKLKVVIKTHI